MASHFGDWSYDSVQRQFRFESVAAHRDFKQAKERLEQDTQSLDSAMKAWSQINREKAQAR